MKKQGVRLLFTKNPYLWKSDPEQITGISQSLGWLSLPDHFTKNVEALKEFALEVKEEGFTHAVLLGMGGSSCVPGKVARKTFEPTKGYLKLLVGGQYRPCCNIRSGKQY